MTVFVNARFLAQPMSGVQRYAFEVLGALDALLTRDPAALDAVGEVTALYPAGFRGPFPDWHAIRLRPVAGGSGHLWEQGPLWMASRGGILVGLGNSGPLLHRAQVLALHDANLWDMPDAFGHRYRLIHRALRPRLARRAAALITVSHHAAGQLARHLDMPQDAFHIVPNCAAHIRRVAADHVVMAQGGLHPGGFILAVGNQSPNKNITALITAHAADPALPPLVIAGGHVPGVARAAASGGGHVIALGRVSDGALRSLYENACGLAFPSLHEGFGIPPLEAMELGLPVLAARRAALPEVLGDAALWCDPASIPDMTRGLRALASLSPQDRAALIARGHARARALTWDNSARRLLALVTRLAPNSRSAGSPSARSAGSEQDPLSGT